MITEHTNKYRTVFLMSGGLILACFVFYKLTSVLYSDVDNYDIALVTSSMMAEDNWCLFLNPLLCFLLRGLTELYRGGDWFTTLSHLGVFMGAWTVAFCILKKESIENPEKTAALLWLILLLTRLNLWNANFTVLSAFFCFVGYYTAFSAESDSPKKNWIAVLFVVLGSLWRYETALLFLPFAGLRMAAGLFKHSDDRERQKHILSSGAVLIATVLFLTGIQLISFQLPSHADSVRYSQARSAIADYPMREWDEIEENAQINEIDYRAARAWNLTDTEHLTTECLEQFARAGRRTATGEEMRDSLMGFFHDWRGHLLFLFFWLICLLLRCWKNQNRVTRITSMLSVLGMGLILLYYIRLGRAPVRVVDSVFLACYSVLMTVPAEKKSGRKEKMVQKASIAVLALALAATIIGSERKPVQWALLSNTGNQKMIEELETENNDLYIWKDYYLQISSRYMNAGKFTPTNMIQHHISGGDWMYGQKYHQELLQEINAKNPALALLDRENTWYVATSPDLMLQILQEHYGDGIRSEMCGSVLNENCWKFYREEDVGNAA